MTRFAARIAFFGVRFRCPVCRAYLRKFLPFDGIFPLSERIIGAGPRSNYACPVCKSSDRERHFYLYLAVETLVLQRPQDILHVAPERNIAQKLRAKHHSRYVTSDLALKGVDTRCDLTNMPFADETFDVVLCNHVLEHVENDTRAMQEIFRVLRCGGWGVLNVPLREHGETIEREGIDTPQKRLETYGQSDHVRLYGEDYTERLQRAGFDVSRWRYERNDASCYGLIDGEYQIVVRKQAAP